MQALSCQLVAVRCCSDVAVPGLVVGRRDVSGLLGLDGGRLARRVEQLGAAAGRTQKTETALRMAHNRIPKSPCRNAPMSRASTSDQKLDMQRNELKRVGETGRLSAERVTDEKAGAQVRVFERIRRPPCAPREVDGFGRGLT